MAINAHLWITNNTLAPLAVIVLLTCKGGACAPAGLAILTTTKARYTLRAF